MAKTDFLAIDADSKAVEDKLNDSLAFKDKYKENWDNLNDCRNLRKILIDFEIETCLEFNYYVYILFVIGFVALLVLLINSWLVWYILRYTGYEEGEKPLPPKPRETIVNVELKDREKIPFY